MPYTVVRGMSDFLHPPVYKTKKDGWRQVPQNGDFGVTYAYAIAAGSREFSVSVKEFSVSVQGIKCVRIEACV